MRKQREVIGKWLRLTRILLLLLFILSGSAMAESQYVFDEVGIFSLENIQEMNEIAKDLEETTDIKVMIFVEESFGSAGAQKYNEAKYLKYRLTGKDITISLATEDKEIDVYSAEEAVVSIANQGLDSIMSYLTSGEYDEGLKRLQKIMINYFEESGNQREGTPTSPDSSSRENRYFSFVVYTFMIIMVIGYFVIAFLISWAYRKVIKKQEKKNQELQDSIFEIKREYEEKERKMEKTLKLTHQRVEKSEWQLQDWNRKYEIIVFLHPNIEAEMEEYLRKLQEQKDRDVAKSYDEAYQELICKENSRDLCEPLKSLRDRYLKMTESEKGYVVSSFEKLMEKLTKVQIIQTRYEEEQEEKRCRKLAENYTREVESFISETKSNVSLQHREMAKKLKREYESLPKMSQSFLNIEMLKDFGAIVLTIETLYRRKKKKSNVG